MKSIKGPRSALTDFIEEAGIKISAKKEAKIIEEVKTTNLKPKQPKKIKLSKPVELINYKSEQVLAEEETIKSYLDSLNDINLDDQELFKLSRYLSKNRMINDFYFDYLCKNSFNNLIIHDCSKIKDEDFLKIKNLKILELHQCGQLTQNTLNKILENCDRLEVLRITGAYLIENFNIPKNIKILDLSYCSRLKNDFIDFINKNGNLEELRLSYCYGLSKDAKLLINVERLFICETLLTLSFIYNFDILTHLSVKRCPNINSLPKLDKIIYLDVEGIVTLESLELSENVEYLNISYCQNLKNISYPNLKYLNISYINMDNYDNIFNSKSLEVLDCSWNQNLNDELFKKLIENLSLKKFFVFGCFGLTKLSSEYAYKNIDNCEVIGNPSETIFLLEG